MFTLTVNGMKNSVALISISDLAGKEVYSDNGTSANVLIKEINLSGLPKGIYFVKVRTDQQTATKKLVLQ
jgi:hypothetical protein